MSNCRKPGETPPSGQARLLRINFSTVEAAYRAHRGSSQQERRQLKRLIERIEIDGARFTVFLKPALYYQIEIYFHRSMKDAKLCRSMGTSLSV